MINRLLRKSPKSDSKSVEGKNKTSLDEIAKTTTVLDSNEMHRLEGGFQSTATLNDPFDLDNTFGSTIPL